MNKNETLILVSKDTRIKLNIMKAQMQKKSVDELILYLINIYDKTKEIQNEQMSNIQ